MTGALLMHPPAWGLLPLPTHTSAHLSMSAGRRDACGWKAQLLDGKDKWRCKTWIKKKDVKLERKRVKISCHGCYQNPIVAVPTINAFHPVSSILSSHGDLPLMHPWKHFSYFFSSACIHYMGFLALAVIAARCLVNLGVKNNLPRILT